MKVLGLAADSGGCGFYRLRAPAAALQKMGVDVTVKDGIDANAQSFPDGRIQVDELHTDADLIIVQRPLDHSLTEVIKQAHRQGIATIVELDDDFSSVHRKNAAYDAIQGKNGYQGPEWVEKAAALADHVTVSTPQLSKYARHGRFSILRNCVPDEIFGFAPATRNFEQPRIGWTGSVQTHPDDLQQTKRAVGEVLKTNGLNFTVIGDGEFVATNLGLDKGTNVFATGWVPIEHYYGALANHLDIGIVPLEISTFNEAKSALKGLEYAALGIPFVASPTREYLRMEAYGIGKVAKTPGEWRKQLQRMIDRTSETERIAREARDRMEHEHTYSVAAPQWIEAWEKAIDYRKTHPNG
jgi:glycosyltransferase involved in cell wall biosynthesis